MGASTKFCRQCGAKRLGDSRFCEICGTPVVIPEAATVVPQVAEVAQPKVEPVAMPPEASVSIPKAPTKRVIVAIALVLVIVVALVVPWVPVVKSKVVQEEFTYSYTYPVTRENQRRESILSSETVRLKPLKSFTQTDYYWISKDFHLEKGWNIEVRLNTDGYQDVSVYVKDGNGWDGDDYYGSTEAYGSFMAPRSGNFHVIITNYALYSGQGHTASVELTAEWTEVQHEQRSVTETATFDVTRYDVTYVSPIDLLLDRI